MQSTSPFLKIYDKNEEPQMVSEENMAITFPYPLDNFQKQGIYGIENQENILITAHTGSGKTVLAIYAIAYCIKNNKKVIYTSPTKSLSNQKFAEFREKFESVGILTGDIKMNPDAQCMIMTTEILRNMLYKKNDLKYNIQKTESVNINIEEVGAVIFDEVHYINDPDRGKVWEEVIVLLPRDVILVMLSATIDKPEIFSSWVGDMKEKTIHLIPTSHRVVPLRHYFWKGTAFDNQGKEEMRWSMVELLSEKGELKNYDLYRNKYKVYDINRLMDHLVDRLVEDNHIPALFFKFSRKKCESLCRMVRRTLLTHEEIAEVERIFDYHMRNYKIVYEKLPQYQSIYKQLLKGVVYHHSGLIPILKEIVEILYTKGLVKILFATETFAIGVNMPTKTVLFTELKKYDNKGERWLRSDEYLQMSGRAGRRGLDKFGTVILLPTFDMLQENDMKKMMTGKSPSIQSKFQLSYQFVLKTLMMEEEDIENVISKTLVKKEMENNIEELMRNNELIDQKLEKFDIDEERKKKWKRWKEIKERLSNTFFKLQKKDKVKLEREMKNLEENMDFHSCIENYQKYDDLEDEKRMNLLGIYHSQNLIKKNMEKLKEILREEDYIQPDSNLPTKKGIVASTVNDCQELLFTEMIFRGYLDDLEFPEIIAILATFIHERDGEEKYLNDLNVPNSVRYVIKMLTDLGEEFHKKELNKNLLMDIDYQLYLDFVEPAYIWASGGSIQDIYNVTSMYDGNFVKAIMRINNICDNLSDICKTLERYDISVKLENSTSILIRDITSIHSLYVQ